jgi:hypothetical protein
VKNLLRGPLAAALILPLILTSCGFDSHEVRTWVLPPKRQSIDIDSNHWVPYAFSEGNITVTLKVPPDFRTFHVVVLPELDFDKYSQRRLLMAQYDYRSTSIEELAQFEIRASFVRLAAPLSTTDVSADALNRALRVAQRRPPRNDDDPIPALIAANNRQWIHLDWTNSKFGGLSGESYGTLIDPNTVFFVSATYLDGIRKDPAWFESRRALLQSIRDGVAVRTQ